MNRNKQPYSPEQVFEGAAVAAKVMIALVATAILAGLILWASASQAQEGDECVDPATGEPISCDLVPGKPDPDPVTQCYWNGEPVQCSDICVVGNVYARCIEIPRHQPGATCFWNGLPGFCPE